MAVDLISGHRSVSRRLLLILPYLLIFTHLGVGNSFWMAYAGIVAQGVDVEPLSYAGKEANIL